jgi:hypothetical protein
LQRPQLPTNGGKIKVQSADHRPINARPPNSSLPTKEPGYLDILPNSCRMKRIGAIERLDCRAVGGLDEEQATYHARLIVRDERAGHDDPHAVRARVGKERLMGVVIGEPRRQRASLSLA